MKGDAGGEADLSAMRMSGESPFDIELCGGDENGGFVAEKDSIV